MKIIVKREELSEAVINLSRAVMAKSSIPVMEGILFSAENGRLNMYAYNLEMGITKTLDVEVEEPGEIVLNARLFGEIIRKLNGATVTVTVDERLRCRIESENTKFDIIGMQASDFPEMPSFTDGNEFKIDGTVLRDMVRQTVFSAAVTDISKPVFTGLYFDIKDSELDIVAIDGFRIAVRKEKIDECEDASFIVAAKSVGEAVKIISDKTEKVTVSVGKKHVCFMIDGYVLIARLLEGTFMNYKTSIRDKYLTEVNIGVRDITDIIDRISLIINENIKKPVKFSISDGRVDFTCTTALGRADDSCEAKVTGDRLEIGVNNRYLLDALHAIDCDEITMKFNGPESPILLTPTEGNSFVYMIMPMLLNVGGSSES